MGRNGWIHVCLWSTLQLWEFSYKNKGTYGMKVMSMSPTMEGNPQTHATKGDTSIKIHPSVTVCFQSMKSDIQNSFVLDHILAIDLIIIGLCLEIRNMTYMGQIRTSCLGGPAGV